MSLRIRLLMSFLILLAAGGPAPMAGADQFILLARNSASAPAEMERLQKQAEELADKSEWARAKEAYEQLYDLQVRHQGRENQLTLATRLSIAVMLASLERYAEAEKIYRELLEAQARLSGPASLETRDLLDKLGLVLFRQATYTLSKYNEAEEIYRQLYELELEADGEDGQAYYLTGFNLAVTLMKLGKYDEASRLYEKTIAVKERLSNPQDATLLSMHSSYGLDLYAHGDYEKAKEHFVKAYQGRKKSWGGAVPLNDGINLSSALAKLNEWEAFDKLIDEIFQFWENTAPENIADTFFTSYAYQGCMLRQENQLDRAAKLSARLEALGRKNLKKGARQLDDIAREAAMIEAAGLEKEEKFAAALAAYARRYELRPRAKVLSEIYFLLERIVKPHYIFGQEAKADQMLAELKADLKRDYDPESTYETNLQIAAITLPFQALAAKYSPGEPVSGQEAARLGSLITELNSLQRQAGKNSQNDAVIRAFIGLINIFAGDLDEGEKILRKSLGDIEKIYRAGYQTQTLYVSCERLELGLGKEILSQALQDLGPLRLNREGRRLMEKERYAEAKKSFAEARQTMVRDQADTALKRLSDEVTTIMDRQGYAKAKEHYDRQIGRLGEASGPGRRLLHLTDYYLALAEFNLGQLEAAEKQAREALRAMEKIEDSRPDQDKARQLLALIDTRRQAEQLGREADSLSARGKFNEAREAYSRLYSLLEAGLGLQHRETLGARFNVARMYELGGQDAAARDLYEGLLAVQERALGAGHQDVQATRARLARLASAAPLAEARPGPPPADREGLARQLAELEKSPGRDHPETLAVREKLADLRLAEDDPAGAEKEYAAIISIRERKQGREHLDTLRSRERLAQALAAQGRLDRALSIYSQVLPLRERIQGPDHEDVEAALLGLVALYDQKGDSAAARTATDRLQDIHDGKKLKEDPAATPSSESTADMAAEFGSYKSALDGYERALAVKRRVLGPEAPATLALRQKLAGMRFRLGDYAGARELHREILDIRSRTLGPDNPATLESKLNLASACLALKDRPEAEKLLKEVLAVQERILGPKHPDTLSTRQMLGL